MGNTDSKSTLRKNNVRTIIDVSLEKFQEKVKGIGDATEELKESFRKVLLPATELEEYLLSLPEIPGDVRFDGWQDEKQKSLESVKRFKASLSDYKTASCKSVQDFLQFAKQQMEGICLTSKGSQSLNSLEAFAFPETDTDEGTDITCQSEKQLSENRESKGTNLNKTLKLEDILALFQTEETLLKERDEIREKYYQDRQLRDAELELEVSSLNIKKSDLEKQLQIEQRKCIMFEKTKKELENLRNENSRLSDQLRRLQYDLDKQSLIMENENKEWSKRLKEKEEEIKSIHKEFNDTLEKYKSENTLLKQELQSERSKVGISDQLIEEHDTLKRDHISVFDQLQKLRKDLSEQSSLHEEEKNKWLKSIKKKDDEIAKHRKDLDDANKQHAKEVMNNIQSIMENVDRLQKQNMDLKQNEYAISEKFKIKQSNLSQEISGLKMSLEKANAEKEYIIRQHTETLGLIKINNTNKVHHLEEEIRALKSENHQLIKTIQEMQVESDRQNQEISSVKNTNVQHFKEENETLICSSQAGYEKHESCRKDFTKLESENQALNAEIKQADKDHDQKVKCLSDIIEKHQLDINKTNLTNRNLLTENKTLTTKLDQCKTTLQKSESNCLIANQKIKKLEDEKKLSESQKESLRKELGRYKNETISLNEKIQLQTKLSEKQGNELICTKNQLSDQKDEISRLQNQNEWNKDQIDKLQRVADGLIIEKNRLSDTYISLLHAHELINSELYQLKAKQILKIQMYSSCRGDLLSGVEAELMAMLRSRLENGKLELEFSPCARQSEIDPGIPTLLLCITASRLRTDVTNAIQGLTLTNSMALVIFHHKDKHVLPSQASDRILIGSELSGIGGIYDFAFLATTGLHKNCQLNNNSIVSLIHFLRKQ